MSRYNNRYQYKRDYNKSELIDKKNKTISLLIILIVILLFVINHLHYDKKSLYSDIKSNRNDLNEIVREKDAEVKKLRIIIDSLQKEKLKPVGDKKIKVFKPRKEEVKIEPVEQPTIVVTDTTK